MKFINKEIQYLHPNFFFKHIKVDVFRAKYFNYLINQEYHKNKTIFSQDDKSDYVYFIKEGEVEILMNNSLLSLNELVVKCGKLLGKGVNECKSLATEFKEYSNELNKSRQIRVKFVIFS